MASKAPIVSIPITGSTQASETCPSKVSNRPDKVCANFGAGLNCHAGPLPDSTTTRRTFRDHLSPMMRTELAFEYYEVRPCIERDRQVSSYADEGDYGADLKSAQESGNEFRTFWSLYGIDTSGHTAIGDFVSKNAAHEVMNAILAIPAAARNAIAAVRPSQGAEYPDIATAARHAADWLDDLINQSSNNQRI